MTAALEHYLHTHIPLSLAMGVKVKSASLEKVILSAPFAPNINHKKTVFGGSLHAVCTLACWSLLHLHVDKHIQIVIAKSDISYLLPVNSDFNAECLMPDPEEWKRFLKALMKKGKGRIQLSAKIIHNDCLCVDFSGVFVAQLIAT